MGEGNLLLTRGYGILKKMLKEIRKRITKPLHLCPYCDVELKNNIYYVRDIFTGEKIFRCTVCFGEIAFDGERWIAV